MRFLRLDLRAFGPFADAPPLDLSGGSKGLHLIHGPNEAGKSSTLRAIRCLLFGYPPRLADDHRHAYKDLRVGATLCDEQGAELALLRRKGDVRTIRTQDDDGLIADETLDKFLVGLDRTKFDEFFAMDHAELVAGGLAILGGKGNLGSMLFAAGSGLARVDEVRKALEEEMESLFKPTGKNPTINATLAQLREAREISERAMLATGDWVELDATLARERLKKATIDLQIREADAEKRRLERLRDALPVLARIDSVQATLAGYGNAPVLSDGFADRRRDAVIARAAGLKAAMAAEVALAAIATDLEALGPRDVVLDEADAIRRVRDDLGLYRQALENRPIEQSRLDRRQAEAQSLLRELRPDASLDDADSLRISASLRGRVQGLAEELPTLDAAHSAAEAEVARLLAASPGVDRQGVTADTQRQAEALAEAIQQARSHGDLEAQLAASVAELEKLQQQATLDLRRLPLWSGSLEALEALAVPPKSTLLRFENGFREADEALARVEFDIAKLHDDKTRLEREGEREQATGEVPSEEDLNMRRAVRDGAWKRIRRAWIDREPVQAPSRLADEFESTVRSTDDIADRLRTEAGAVAARAQRRWLLRDLANQIVAKSEFRDKTVTDQHVVHQEWRELWCGLGIDPLPPTEMKEWVADQFADLIRKANTIREKRLERDRKAAQIDAYRAEIGRHLESLGEPTVAPREALVAILARAKGTVDRVNVGLRLDLARTSLAKAEAALLDGKLRWSSAVGPLGLGEDATPSQALAVIGRFDDLAGIVRELAELRSRIDEQGRVEDRFEASIGSLRERLGIESSDASIESTALELEDRLKVAFVAEARRDGALKRRDADRFKLDEARDAVDRADAALEALRVEARCDSVEGLVEAERTSNEIKECKRELHSLEQQLATVAGPVSPEKLREQAKAVDPETLEGRIGELTDQLAPLDLERNRLAEVIVRCQVKLEAMDGGPAAADAQQLVEEQVAHLANDVEKYARLRLASAVLREAVERYRKDHQGPVLDRAGALFARLTAGSFRGLKTDLDDRGEPVLLGLRADGTTTLKVDGMSEGTADQLYLALRLASLQTYLDDHEPMPLVVDDILVNFDNARALAALEALAELSNRTQILFFTHHAHLVELARSSLSDDVLFVHHLDFPPVSVATNGSTLESKSKRKKKVAAVVEEE